MIRDRLIPALKSQFAGWEILFDAPPQPIAIFPSLQQAVGRVLVYDDGEEATVLIENITHGHFSPYLENLPESQRDETVTEDVVDFLEALFSDRIPLHCSADKHQGGWVRLDLKDGPVELSPDFQYFLWSRPYQA
jgi:hypothetical protein